MPDLTPEQIALIARKSKLTRPSIYESAAGVRTSIGKETEDALILLSQQQRDKASQYLKAFVDKEERSTDVTDLLELFSDQQKLNAEAASLELSVAFTKFDAFKNDLFGNGNEVFARGLAPLVTSLNVGLGQLKRKYDRFNYNQLHLQAAGSVAIPSLTQDQKKELLSWVAVLVSYT